MTRARCRFGLAAALLLAACIGKSRPAAPSITALDADTHGDHFPIASGAHGGADCNTCHGEFDSFSQFDCTSCHEHDASLIDPAHAGIVAGYAYSPTSCYGCHPTGERAAFDHSQRFPIDDMSHHAGVACTSCHVDPSDRTVFSCTGCHTDPTTTPNHVGVSGYQWESASCYACHPTGVAAGGGASHTAFPIGAGATHDNARVACSSCHPSPDKKVFDCTTCHTKMATDPWHVTVSGYQWESASCYACHPSGDVVFDHPYFPIAMGEKHGALGCSECHSNPAARDQVTCAGGCHPSATMKTKHTPVGGYTYTTATCLACHADSQVMRVAAHPTCPINRGHHNHQPCLTCHPAKRTDKPYGENFKVVNCTACHGNFGSICEP